jgi:hypothetical protein
MSEQVEERDTSDVDLFIAVLTRLALAKCRERVVDADEYEVSDVDAA